MKTTIYELLGMIKDNKAPNVIKYQENILAYDRQSQDYYCEEYGNLFEYLINERRTGEFLNEPVEILETTITYKQDNKIRKLDENSNIFNKGFIDKFTENELILINKINEIIDRVNTLC